MDLLNGFRSPAQVRLIFEEFFYYQLALGLRRLRDRSRRGITMRVREDKIRDALKRDSAVQADERAETRARGNRGRLRAAVSDAPPAGGRRRKRKDDRGSGGGDDRDRKRLSGGADGADGNSRGATLSFGAKDFRARGLRGGTDRERAETRGERGRARARPKRRGAFHCGHARADRRPRDVPPSRPRNRGRAAPLRRVAAQAADRKGRARRTCW